MQFCDAVMLSIDDDLKILNTYNSVAKENKILENF